MLYSDEEAIRDGEFMRAITSAVDGTVEHLSRRGDGGRLWSLCDRLMLWAVGPQSRRRPLCKQCARKRQAAS